MKRLFVGALLFGLVFLVGGATGFALLHALQARKSAVVSSYPAFPVPDSPTPNASGDYPLPAQLRVTGIRALPAEAPPVPAHTSGEFAPAVREEIAGHTVVAFGSQPQDVRPESVREVAPTPVAQARFVADNPRLAQATRFNNGQFVNTSSRSDAIPVPSITVRGQHRDRHRLGQ